VLVLHKSHDTDGITRECSSMDRVPLLQNCPDKGRRDDMILGTALAIDSDRKRCLALHYHPTPTECIMKLWLHYSAQSLGTSCAGGYTFAGNMFDATIYSSGLAFGGVRSGDSFSVKISSSSSYRGAV
jgi:hypothetical protein